jgi:protein ImuB
MPERPRRYLALWLPYLPADWHTRAQLRRLAPAVCVEGPRVFTVKVRGATRLAAVDRQAHALGLRRGMTLADAEARHPALVVVQHDTHANARFLEGLARVAMDFTPSVAFDPPHGLALDITGCAHLFGGEAGLMARLRRGLEAQGVTLIRMAIGMTPDMTRALARFGSRVDIIAQDNTAVRQLPVAAFECGAEDQRALERAGLRTVADVADRPSLLFSARFTQAFTTRLARILGEEDRRIEPYRPLPPCRVEHVAAEPVASHAVVEEIVKTLFERATDELLTRGLGGRRFQTTYVRSDGARRHLSFATSVPTRDVNLLLRLHRDRLETIEDPLDPGFGFDLIRVDVLQADTLDAQQMGLGAVENTDKDVAALRDRLTAIFGRERIVAFAPVDTHTPERAQRFIPSQEAGAPLAWPSLGLERPLKLFETPQLIADGPHPPLQSADDVPPSTFRWRRKEFSVHDWEGPERITEEWWLKPSGFGTRDYYAVTVDDGRRFWIFKARADEPQTPRQWFLHGVFP